MATADTPPLFFVVLPASIHAGRMGSLALHESRQVQEHWQAAGAALVLMLELAVGVVAGTGLVDAAGLGSGLGTTSLLLSPLPVDGLGDTEAPLEAAGVLEAVGVITTAGPLVRWAAEAKADGEALAAGSVHFARLINCN